MERELSAECSSTLEPDERKRVERGKGRRYRFRLVLRTSPIPDEPGSAGDSDARSDDTAVASSAPANPPNLFTHDADGQIQPPKHGVRRRTPVPIAATHRELGEQVREVRAGVQAGTPEALAPTNLSGADVRRGSEGPPVGSEAFNGDAFWEGAV